MKTYLLVVTAAIALCQGCSNPKPCSFDEFLLKANNTIPKIKIHEGDTREMIIEKFKNQFGEEICSKELVFGLELDSQTIRSHFTIYCPLKMSLPPPKAELSIWINKRGIALLNGEVIIGVDSIDNWILNNVPLPPSDPRHKKKIAIRWSDKTPIDYFESGVLEIVKGFELKMNAIANELFEKKYCELDSNQAEMVKTKFPYKLALELEGISPPPPPQLTSEPKE